MLTTENGETLLLIIASAIVGIVIEFILIRGAVESAIVRAHERMREDEEERLKAAREATKPRPTEW